VSEQTRLAPEDGSQEPARFGGMAAQPGRGLVTHQRTRPAAARSEHSTVPSSTVVHRLGRRQQPAHGAGVVGAPVERSGGTERSAEQVCGRKPAGTSYSPKTGSTQARGSGRKRARRDELGVLSCVTSFDASGRAPMARGSADGAQKTMRARPRRPPASMIR
jgi:hypothetical protein